MLFRSRQIQASLRPRNRITVATLAVSPQATPESSAVARPLVVALVAGLLIALGLPVIIDGWLRRRAIRQSPAVAEGDDERIDQLAGDWSGIGLR